MGRPASLSLLVKNFCPAAFWSWSSTLTPKNAPYKEKWKNLARHPAKTFITLNVKYNSSKLCPKAMKPVLESFLYQEIENESNYLIGMVRMIEPLSSELPPSSNSRKCFKKSWDHRFCDHLKVVILSVDLHWLLKDVQGVPEVKLSPTSNVFQKCTQISENSKERVQPVSRGSLLFKKFLTRRPLLGETLKFQMARWIL